MKIGTKLMCINYDGWWDDLTEEDYVPGPEGGEIVTYAGDDPLASDAILLEGWGTGPGDGYEIDCFVPLIERTVYVAVDEKVRELQKEPLPAN